MYGAKCTSLLAFFSIAILQQAISTATLLPHCALGVPGDKNFDYVIVGGGTAGLVVAARLAEASYSVAVVEAGGFYEHDAGNYSTVPAYAVFGAGTDPEDSIPGVDWGFVTTPQKGLNNRSLHYARGKTLGGSSARNYFTYNRPTRDSLSQWASFVGDKSYEFDNFLPYFKKSVKYSPPENTVRPSNASVPSPHHAFDRRGGPLHVSFAIWGNSLSSFVKLAWKKLGISTAHDFVSGRLSGVQYTLNSINPTTQERDTSYSSFLKSVAGTTPIKVYNGTLAKKILFKDSTATAVLVSSGESLYKLTANKEIIISAGAFQSPQLLLVSGVGSADVLHKFGIPVVSNLRGVGQNLQDHFLLGATYEVNVLTHSAVTNATYRSLAQEEYNNNRTGILTNPGGELIAWERITCRSKRSCGHLTSTTREVLNSAPSDWPTFEYLILDAYSGNNMDYQTGAPTDGKMYASPAASVMIPQSRGTVTINSNDTADAPIINPGWLTHHSDQELAVHAFRRLRQMMDTDIMKGVWVEEVVPGREVQTEKEILDVIRRTGIQLFHASSTCKMGKVTDPYAVVDHRARVFGTNNLRVVDVSSFPFLPAGHPQATIYALAEKIADDILAAHNR